MTDELVKRLRGWDHCWPARWLERAVAEAADRIEQLTAERDVAIKWWGESTELTRQARLQYSDEKARAEAAEAERDRQYDENAHRIAMQAEAEAERDWLRHAIMFWLEAEEPDVDAAINMMRAALKGGTP